jgi:phosphoglycerate dehydrogenase-like enzyme
MVLATLEVPGPMPDQVTLDRVVGYVPPYMCAPAYLQLMARMPGLRWVQAQTAGVDGFWSHLPAGVVLANAAGVHDASTAELAVGLILASLRGIDDFARAMPKAAWLHGRRHALADRRVAIVGFGGVGQALARRLAGFECEVVGFARTSRIGAGVHGIAELPSLLPTFDVVVLCLPLTAATSGLVDARFLAAMRDGTLLVNVARGPVVVTGALLAECAAGRLRAALDVTDPEPLPADHPLWRTPGVLISPHVGGNSTAFQPRMDRLVAAQLDRFARGEPLAHVVSRD